MITYHIERKAAKPVYIQLKDTLREAIEDGRLKPLSPMPHVNVIAEQAKVSLRTADNALQELIKEGLCFRRPKKGTFVRPENMVKRQRVCGILGCIDPSSYPLQTLLYCGIMEEAARKGILPFLLPSSKEGRREETPEEVIRRCDRGSEFDIQGVIVTENEFPFEKILKLAEQYPKKRFFHLCYQTSFTREMRDNVTAIINDDFSGAYCLAQYIFSEYPSRTAAILSIPLQDCDLTYEERVRGFRTAAKEFSIRMMQANATRHSGKLDEQICSGYAAAKSLLEKKNLPDVILCVNDLLAYGAQKAVREAGLEEQVRITGYDCLHTLPDFNIPTVRVDYTEMGRLAVEKMMSPDARMNTVIKLMPEIIKNKH